MKRGYKSAIGKSKDLKNLVDNLNTLDEIRAELLEDIYKVARGHCVTKAELKRDFGFTDSSLRLLKMSKQFMPLSADTQRETFDLEKALKIRVLHPGIVAAKNVKTTRKHNNIVTIYRDYFNRNTDSRM